jgi:hypothetical protein
MAMDKMGDESVFADSDDDDDDKGAKKKQGKVQISVASDSYAKSLSFKSAKSVNASLYYTDHSKLKNNGDGLEPEVRNVLVCEHSKTIQELTMLQDSIKQMNAQAATLVSEPTNEEASTRLGAEEAELQALNLQLEAARGLKANEKYKLQIKRRIENMASFWRKRKRLTMDFLISMEECTDGVISAKKCLAGDGQIDIESDETAVKNATAYFHSLKTRPPTKFSETTGLPPSENFVGVVLDAIGCVERVVVVDDGEEVAH